MSKYKKTIKADPLEFNGETVNATLRRIKRKDFMRVLPFLQQVAALRETGVKDDSGEAIALTGKLLDELSEALPGYVVEFSGLVDDEGAAVTLETVLEEAYFLPVAMHLAMQLVSTSAISEDQSGNSSRPSTV